MPQAALSRRRFPSTVGRSRDGRGRGGAEQLGADEVLVGTPQSYSGTKRVGASNGSSKILT